MLLREDVAQTAWWTKVSLDRAREMAEAGDDGEDPSISSVPNAGDDAIHPHVQRIVGATCGHLYAPLEGRLVRYPTQPDFAVNTANLPVYERQFGLDLSYEEGILANEAPREAVLIRGFSLKLASAIVAMVEEP